MSTELINVVIVGLGLSGAPLARQLAAALPASHRVVAITAQDFGYYPVASLRAAVVEKWEDSITAPVATLFPAGSRHIVHSSSPVISLDAHSVTISKNGTNEIIPFSHCIIATGSTYAFPARPPTDATTIAQVNAVFKTLQTQIAAAKSILVVGGGATGVEFCGEVAARHKGIKVTLVHSDEELFEGYNKKVGASLLSQLKAVGTEVILGARADTRGLSTGPIEMQKFEIGGKTVEADFLYIAYGCTPNSSLMNTLSPSLLNDQSQIKVSRTLQLADPLYPNIFAIGDVNDVAELKLAVHAQAQIPIIIKNINSLIKGGPDATLKEHTPGKPMILITFGPDGGAGELFGWFVSPWFASKMKSQSMFVSKFKANYL